MIVRNEEANLAACLGLFTPLVDETVVIDCGSTDRTVEIALRHGARVIPCEWCDDFAAARNAWHCHACGEWIFWLDGDEDVDEANVRRLERLFSELSDSNVVYLMKQLSCGATGTEIVHQARLYRRQDGVAWQNRVHEQVLSSLMARRRC